MTAPTLEQLDKLLIWQETEATEARRHRNDFCIRKCDGVLAALRSYRELRQVFAGQRQPEQVIPFTHWSKDPLVPYKGCTCSSCLGPITITITDRADGG